MDELNLTYLKQNTELYQQIQRISLIKDLNIQINGYNVILEYMNLYCLSQLLHIDIDTDDFSIINMIDQYAIYNRELHDIMLAINDDYYTWTELGIDELDIELFLNDIQKIYKIIKSNYGDIFFDKNLDFCQRYFEYVAYIELKDQCFFEIKKLMNYTPDNDWYDYLETISWIHHILDKYNQTGNWEDQKSYLQQMLEMINKYYEQNQ